MIKFINFLFLLLLLNACNSTGNDSGSTSSSSSSTPPSNQTPPPADPDALAKAAAQAKAKAVEKATAAEKNAAKLVAEVGTLKNNSKITADKKTQLETLEKTLNTTKTELTAKKADPKATASEIENLKNKLSTQTKELETKANSIALDAKLISEEQKNAKDRVNKLAENANKNLDKAKNILNKGGSLSDTTDLNNKERALGQALFDYENLSITAIKDEIDTAFNNIENANVLLNKAILSFYSNERNAKKTVDDADDAAKKAEEAKKIADAAKKKTVSAETQKQINEAMISLDPHKAKKDQIANIKLSTADDFTNLLKNYNDLFKFLPNLEAVSQEQRDNFVQAVKNTNEKEIIQNLSHYISFYFGSNFKDLYNGLGEIPIYSVLQKQDKYKDKKLARTISQGIHSELRDNYTKSRDILVNSFNELLSKNVEGLFEKIDIQNQDNINNLNNILIYVDNNKFVKYVENKATLADAKILLNTDSAINNYFDDSSAKILSAILDKYKANNVVKIKSNNIFTKYYENYKKIALNHVQDDQTKEQSENIINMIEILLSKTPKNDLIKNDNFDNLLQKINADIIYKYIEEKTSDQNIKDIFINTYDPEVLEKLIPIMNKKNIPIPNDGLPGFIGNCKKIKDNNAWKNDFENYKKSIKVLFANIDSLLIQNTKNFILSKEISTLLTDILITTEDRKEFYAFLDKQNKNYMTKIGEIYPYAVSLTIINNQVIDMIILQKAHDKFSQEDYDLINNVIKKQYVKKRALNILVECKNNFVDEQKRLPHDVSDMLKNQAQTKINNTNNLIEYINKINTI